MNIGTGAVRLLVLVSTLLLLGGFSGSVSAGRFCEPFLHGKVKQSVLDAVLDAAKAGDLYRIQPATSSVKFCIDSVFDHVEGNLTDFEGGVAMKLGAEEGGQALLSINVDSVSTSNRLVDKLVKSRTFIDVKNYPEILFVSSGFKWLKGTAGVVRGDLTLHGVTRPVIFDVELTDVKGRRIGRGSNILIKITSDIKRSDFGMRKMRPLVKDTVKLCISARATKANLSCLECHGS
ncbi:MAG: YceI family protein [Pseudomonadota bacterium]